MSPASEGSPALAGGVNRIPGASKATTSDNIKHSIGASLGDVAFWLILLFGGAALGVLNLGQMVSPLNALLNQVASFIPSILGAVESAPSQPYWRRYPNALLRLCGYTAALGADSANKVLAQTRADIARSILTAAAVDPRRIKPLSGGKINPVDSNATIDSLAENRRAELVTLTSEGPGPDRVFLHMEKGRAQPHIFLHTETFSEHFW